MCSSDLGSRAFLLYHTNLKFQANLPRIMDTYNSMLQAEGVLLSSLRCINPSIAGAFYSAPPLDRALSILAGNALLTMYPLRPVCDRRLQ